MNKEEILFQYQVKTKSQYGTRFYYFYADTDIENYLNNKKIKYVRYAKDTALNKKEKRIRELFKENKQLKKQLEQNSKINVSDHKYASQKEDEAIAYKHIIDELEKRIDKCAEEIINELNENHHLSCGVALGIRQKLINYRELKGSDKE